MKENLQRFKNDSLIKYSFIASFIITIIVSLLIYTSYLPPYVPFFNSLPWGEQRLAHSILLMFLPISFILILILNSLLSFLFYEKYTLISRILAVNTLLFIVLGFLAFLQIKILIY